MLSQVGRKISLWTDKRQGRWIHSFPRKELVQLDHIETRRGMSQGLFSWMGTISYVVSLVCEVGRLAVIFLGNRMW